MPYVKQGSGPAQLCEACATGDASLGLLVRDRGLSASPQDGSVTEASKSLALPVCIRSHDVTADEDRYETPH